MSPAGTSDTRAQLFEKYAEPGDWTAASCLNAPAFISQTVTAAPRVTVAAT